MTEYNISKVYNQYCDDVLTRRIAASKNIILACKRYKSWFKRNDIYMDYTEVDKRIKLVSKMKHFKGKSNGQSFILLPYQQWIFANLFGWKYVDTNLRVIKKALLFCARKSGKTALAAAICLTQLILDNNNGQEIDFVANSGQQARIGFEMTKGFAESMDPRGLLFRRYRDSIKMPSTKSVIDVLNADGMTLDGRNSSTFIQDEFAAAKNWDVWNVMISSQGFQTQPLAIAITSANFLLDGYPCYEWRKTCIDVLKGDKKDDSTFAALYELDPEDDWIHDEKCWIKANPSIGTTVTYEYLRDQVQAAINQTSLEFGVKTKHMNLFCQSSDTWIPNNYVKGVMQNVDLQQLKNEYCYMGVDLSAVSDLTCWTVMFPPNDVRSYYPSKYIFKTWIYIPESALDESVNKQIYKHWINIGAAYKTPGNVVDYDWILKDQVDLQDTVQYANVAYDSWNATSWAINATNAGLPLEPFSQALGNFNKPTKLLEMLIRSDRCIIDNNIAVLWMFNNVKLKFDYNENCKPDKSTPEAKIDACIAMTEALGGCLAQGGIDVEIV